MEKSVKQLIADIDKNPTLAENLKNNPDEALKEYALSGNPIQWDNWIYRIVVVALGLAIVLIIVGVIILLIGEKTPNDNLVTLLTSIGSAAIGALAGLLAPSPRQTTTE